MILSVITWNVDPELFSLGPFSIRYYGLFFAISFMLGYYIIEKMLKTEKAPEDWIEKLFMYVVLATVIGARLGHVFFYGWGYYSQHPGEILKIWEGGLASHGGAIGIITAIILFSKKVSKKHPLWALDRLIVAITLSAFFIRMGNLMNSEIYGHPTSFPWAFKFITNINAWTQGAEPVYSQPSHPTQIYEALSYLSLFVLTYWAYLKTKAKDYEGLLFGIGMTGIFVARFFIEFVKENQEAFEEGMLLNMGQLLSIPFVIVGGYLIYRSQKHKAA